MVPARLGSEAEVDQGLDRSLGAQQRLGQLEQLIGAPGQASVQLTAELAQLISFHRRRTLVSVIAEDHTAHRGHRRLLEASRLPRIARWPPSCQTPNHVHAHYRCQRLNDKLRTRSRSAAPALTTGP